MESKVQKQMNQVLNFIKQSRVAHAQLEKFYLTVVKMEQILEQQKLAQKEINEQFVKYEEINLKTYATEDEKLLDKYSVYKHPQKTEIKERLDGMHSMLTNPYKTMRLFIRWEQLDIQALMEAIEIRGQMDSLRTTIKEKREAHMSELEKLN